LEASQRATIQQSNAVAAGKLAATALFFPAAADSAGGHRRTLGPAAEI
jgi:hypothetical protein